MFSWMLAVTIRVLNKTTTMFKYYMTLLPCLAVGYALIRRTLSRTQREKDYKPTTGNKWIGGTFYIGVPSDRLEDFLRRVFVDSAGRLGGSQMRCFRVSKITSDRYGRYRTVTANSLQRLLNQCLAGGMDTIYFQDREEELGDRYDQPHVGWGVDAHSLDIFGNAHRLMFKMPLEMLDQQELHSYLQGIISEFKANYGGIYIGSLDYVESLMYATLHMSADTFSLVEAWDTDGRMTRFDEEIEFYNTHLEQLRTHVPRAEWGNVLSPEHVSALGGEDQIRRECDCHLVEHWGENVYIQATASPRQASADDLARLNQYFRPIRFTSAPEPAYPHERGAR